MLKHILEGQGLATIILIVVVKELLNQMTCRDGMVGIGGGIIIEEAKVVDGERVVEGEPGMMQSEW